MTVNEMRQQARRYRDMVSSIDDAKAKKALLDLADEYDALAKEAEAREMRNEGPGAGRP